MLSVTMLLSVALVVVAQRVEEEIPMCNNNNDLTPRHQLECPARAVCGVKWRGIRDSHNIGTRCQENSIVIVCVCQGNKPCPVQNESHLFYNDEYHLLYVCEPKCDFGMCSNYTTVAVESVRNSPNFGRNMYNKINCRCPGHNQPMATGPGMPISTTYYRTHVNTTTSVTSQWHICSGDGPLPFNDTVCGGSRARRGRLGLLEEEDSWA